MLCPRQGANCCYFDNVKLLQDLIKNLPYLGPMSIVMKRNNNNNNNN